jgi:hypothetical protein
MAKFVPVYMDTRLYRPGLAVRSSDGVITKLANSLRNIDISLFMFVSITFQIFRGIAESSLTLPLTKNLITHHPDSNRLCLDWSADQISTYFLD